MTTSCFVERAFLLLCSTTVAERKFRREQGVSNALLPPKRQAKAMAVPFSGGSLLQHLDAFALLFKRLIELTNK
jgi:hypothetical protein